MSEQRYDEMKSLKELSFPLSYFEDESREGFYVSSMMKRCWAAQLVVLSEVAKVCERHGIKWFADCGTLLGAVRHGGYIPWDDDLDICMLRPDFEKFAKIAERELPKGYSLTSIHNYEEFPNLTLRVSNGDMITFSDDRMTKFYGCPYIIGIDIFPLDGICRDGELEEERIARGMEIERVLLLISLGKYNTAECRRAIAAIERNNNVKLNRKRHIVNEILRVAEKIYSRYSIEEADHVGLMTYWIPRRNHKYAKELFDDVIWIPFEGTKLPVPARYDEVLRIEYGDYMEIRRTGSLHDYPIYKDQEETLRKNRKENTYRYTFKREDLQKSLNPNRKSFRKYCSFIVNYMLGLHGKVDAAVTAGDGQAEDLFEKCREAAVAARQAILDKFGADVAAGELLQEYCTILDGCELAYAQVKMKLDAQVNKLAEELGKLLSRREVVFLPCKADWWKSMEPIWHKVSADAGNDVYVIPVPYYELKVDKSVGDMHDERKLFPDYVPVTDMEGYDFDKRHPDAIFIQNPFDEFNSSISLPNYFYSGHLWNCTDSLVYVPPLDLEPPMSEKDVANAALPMFVENPAVVYADSVILKDEKMRSIYIDTMAKLAGKETRKLWERKIVCMKEDQNGIQTADDIGTGTKGAVQTNDGTNDDIGRDDVAKREEKAQEKIQEKASVKTQTAGNAEEWRKNWGLDKVAGKKILLYHTAVGFLLKYRKRAIDKLKSSMDEIAVEKESIFCLWDVQEVVENLPGLDQELWEQFSIVKEYYASTDLGVCYERGEAKALVQRVDAFYGNAGHLAHQCRELGIPVMLQSV